MMRKKSGFTLIELLVVISIIALLLSILMPSLGRARRSARNVVCLANTRQISLGWTMFSNDKSGRLPTGWMGIFSPAGGPDLSKQSFWNCEQTGIYPYIGNDRSVFMCPEVRGVGYEDIGGEGVPTGIPHPWSAWGKWWFETSGSPDAFKGDYGSYGLNAWASSHPTMEGVWRRFDASGGNRVPLMAESYWMSSYAYHTDQPPRYQGDMGGGSGDIRRFVMDRHMGRTNVLFLDMSSRNVDIKELWTLKWSRDFNINGPWTVAGGVTPNMWTMVAPWMSKYPEFSH